jgi:site-specific recombinase XerD
MPAGGRNWLMDEIAVAIFAATDRHERLNARGCAADNPGTLVLRLRCQPQSGQEFFMNTDAISLLRQRMIDDMTARHLGLPTQRAYIRSCKRFAAFLKRSPEMATADDIRLFQVDLAGSGISIGNRNGIVTGVKFLFRVTLRRHDLAAELYSVREPRKISLVMSPDEIERLLAKAKTLRLRAMLSLAYGCGLRISEVVRLKVGDIDSPQNIIRIVHSKGRKDRNVMLPPEVLAILRQWWIKRPTKYDAGVPKEERLLFPSRQSANLSKRQLSRLFRQTLKAAGVRKPVTFHSLRHSFATHLLEGGTDIRIIQALLGHEKLDTTAHYTRVATGIISAVKSPIGLLSGRSGKPKKRRRQTEPA